MERLHQVISAIMFLLCLGGCRVATAGDYCSLAVRVLSPDQRRPLEVPVSVMENSGRVIEKGTTHEDVKFCDLGIVPVTVTVGGDTCNQTVVRDVPLSWDDQYVLTVTYDPGPCMPERPPAPIPSCQELFRIADPAGNWLSNAFIQFSSQQFATRQTDYAGRALLVLKAGQHADGSVSANGYKSRSFSVSCSRLEPIHEELLKLERQ